ncbi:hypothetical protein TNCT_68361 [Trichonephila clavata]|uniref:Uncharacterized protein n=1 Tax=Trichonephila clavata TaxID=2740835 RepID=A0A8X6I5K6_TRICU|nr:hypothetical protein TNCT_68361 [Trichonephila clavata]
MPIRYTLLDSCLELKDSSSDICSEFIDVMGRTVLQEILTSYFPSLLTLHLMLHTPTSWLVALRYVSVRKACANECLVRVLSGVS